MHGRSSGLALAVQNLRIFRSPFRFLDNSIYRNAGLLHLRAGWLFLSVEHKIMCENCSAIFFCYVSIVSFVSFPNLYNLLNW